MANIAKELGFKSVGDLWELDYSKDFNNDEENISKAGKDLQDNYRWAKIQCQPDVPGNYKGFVIDCWAGEGCEPSNIGLISLDGKNWAGGAFTKTQYAEQFVKCHLLVINLLKACKELGILKNVSDEGDYWETGDINCLADNINESTKMIEKFSKVLKKNFETSSRLTKNVKVISEIDKSKNFVTIGGKDAKLRQSVKNRIDKNIK